MTKTARRTLSPESHRCKSPKVLESSLQRDAGRRVVLARGLPTLPAGRRPNMSTRVAEPYGYPPYVSSSYGYPPARPSKGMGVDIARVRTA